jgi:DNA-directed RNA polymerase alpha subunit
MTDIIERLRATTREAIAEIERLRGKQEPIIDDAFLDTPLREIDFGPLITARVHHLKCWKIGEGELVDVPVKTVRDLVGLTEAELLRAHNVGRSTVESIKRVLAAHGLRLGMDT